MFPFQENLLQLWRESRGNVIGGVLAVIIVAVAGLFWNSIRKARRRLVNGPAVPVAPQVSAPAQEIQSTAPVESPPVIRTTSRNPLPRPPIAGFVARRDQNGRDIVERLKEELAPAKEQLIVLWGAGGVGKTTLAAETARAMRAVFEDGIVWTSADGKPDFSLSTLLDDIATHLGHPELRQLTPTLKDLEVHNALLQAPDTLIVLDNFETVSPEEQERCADWLTDRASCPALITSRDEVRHARPVHILAMSESEAKEFLKRLISDAHNQCAFEQLDHEQIIKAADRIPLVLQWVVKRIDSAKQPRTVLDELSHGEGDAAERVFDRSFDLPQVGADGRAVLLALSLFVPNASRDALCEVSGFDNEVKRLETAVQQLTELWLIQTSDANNRLGIEGLTRELAKARLEKDPGAHGYRQRFVNYYCRYAAANAGQRVKDYDLLVPEKNNVLSAMDIAFELADWETVQALAYSIALPVTGVLSIRGYWAEALKANQQALEAARRSGSQSSIAIFAHNLAIMYDKRGEPLETRQLLNESLEIQRKLGNETGIARGLHQLAVLTHHEGEFLEAEQLYNESLEIEKKLKNQRGIALTLHQLAMLAQDQSKLDDAWRLFNESLEIKQKLGDQQVIATTLHHLGMVAQLQDKFTEARRLYTESLQIKREFGNQSGIASTLGMLGRLTEAEGNLKEAARLYRKALDILIRIESPLASVAQRDLERVEGNRDK